MPIVPDDKDWTWVLLRPCPECGFDARRGARVHRTAAAANAYVGSAFWNGPPTSSSAGRRMIAGRHSGTPATFVTCAALPHRLGLMLREDDPLYPNWDQDLTAVEERYIEQDPATVAASWAAPTSWRRSSRV